MCIRDSDESALYNAIKIGTYDYISKSNLSGVILGLSGGIDSALTLAIANDIFKDDDASPRIERTLNESIKEINGFRTKKWTTTISTKNNKMVIEEWVVDELPLRDSLYAYISSISEENNELINFIDSVKFSSQDFILGVDSSYTIKKSDEIIVMARLGIDSNNGWVQSALFEIRELYALSFDPLTFTIPEDFERIEIESDEKD